MLCSMFICTALNVVLFCRCSRGWVPVFLVDPVDLSMLEKAQHSAALALLAPAYVVEQMLMCYISPQ